MKAQDVFDKMVAHVRNQGVPSMNGFGSCKYRLYSYGDGEVLSEPLMCAVGALIPDSRYSRTIEGNGAMSSEVLECVPYKYRNSKLKREVLENMQTAHDEAAGDMCDFKVAFESRVKAVALKLGLVYISPTSC